MCARPGTNLIRTVLDQGVAGRDGALNRCTAATRHSALGGDPVEAHFLLFTIVQL